VLYTG